MLDTISNYDEFALLKLIPNLYSGSFDDVSLLSIKAGILTRAEILGMKPTISKLLSELEKKQKKSEAISKRVIAEQLNGLDDNPLFDLDGKGEPKNITSNYLSVMHSKNAFGNVYGGFETYDSIRYNILGNYAEVNVETTDRSGNRTVVTKRWDDSDEAKSRAYIEQQYGLYSLQKHDDALRILFKERAYNPVIEILQNIQWDGVERCEHFLTRWGKAEDSAYTRECSRLIFAGGIWRMMLPGCKMDDVVILIGEQGGGKSSLVRFLAIHDDYFGEIKSVEGKESIEQLDGKWILEIPELAAFTRAKEVEAIKAFITRQKDNYRKPFDRNVDDRARRCIFIGTTNLQTPLLDATGGRRFYPVQTHCNGYDLFKHEDECRDYIKQCWAEALAKYMQGKMPNFAREDLVAEYRAKQEAATQDDWRIGAIEEYLQSKAVGECVCIKQIMDEVISTDKDHPVNPTSKDSKEIGIIMAKQKNWKKCESRKFFAKYGQQRSWEKIKQDDDTFVEYANITEDGDEIPF